MSPEIWVPLAGIGYIIVAIIIGRITFDRVEASAIKEFQQDALEKAKKYPATKGHYARMSEDELFAYAYEKIKEHGSGTFEAHAVAILWPILVPTILLIGAIIAIATGVGMLFPKTAADKRIEQIQEMDKLKKDNAKLLRLAKEMDISTEGLSLESSSLEFTYEAVKKKSRRTHR